MSVWLKAVEGGEHRRVPAESARPLAAVLGVKPGAIRPDLWPAEGV